MTSGDNSFDYFLAVSTLVSRQPLEFPRIDQSFGDILETDLRRNTIVFGKRDDHGRAPLSLRRFQVDKTFNAGMRLVRIGEEKLVAVEILDHQQLVAPAAVLDRNASGFELGA